MELERRTLSTDFEVRQQGDTLTIAGYAYKFYTRSQNLGGFVEQVRPGAGDESARQDDIRALFNHDPSITLGRSVSGTLRVAEDSEGLNYEVSADSRQSYVRDLAISLERGDVTQSSFAFRVIEDDWGFTEDEFPLRTLVKIALFDVSPVTYPAYTSSTAGVGRAIEGFYESRGISCDVSLPDAIRRDAVIVNSGDEDTRRQIARLQDIEMGVLAHRLKGI